MRQEASGRRWLVVLVGVSVVSAVAGAAAMRLIESPTQVMAEAEAPEATIITAVVEDLVLEQTVVARGTVAPSSEIRIGYGRLLSQGSLTEAGGDGVLTGVMVAVGDEVASGQVIAEVSGRPMVVLPGAKPAYRDIKPGDSGTDVRQLQQALGDLGYTVSIDGEFGSQTQAALEQFYQDCGYEPQATDSGSGEDEEALAQARSAVRGAQAAVDQLRAGKSSSDAEASSEQDLARAEDALAEAQAALGRLEARIGVVAPRTEIVFVESLPANVTAVTPNVNTTVPEVIAVVTPDEMRVTANVPADQVSLLVDGTGVTLEFSDADVTGTVEGRGQADTESGTVPVYVRPDSPLAYSLAGSGIKVTFTTAKTESSVLAVPLGAVSSDSGGRRYVIVQDDQGDLSRCQVEVGVTGDDLVEVTPVVPDTLEAGDKVVISG